MPASLDEATREVIVKVTYVTILVLLGACWNAQTIVNQNKISSTTNGGTVCVLKGCLLTLGIMIILSAITTYPIIAFGSSNTKEIEVSSSINFCEADFQDNQYIAEPANAASSVASYIPLALIGLFGPPSKEWRSRSRSSTVDSGTSPTGYRRFALAYTALWAIGIGSTLLHALLTAGAQGGDELPMLWLMACLSYITLDIILIGIRSNQSNNNKTKKTTTATATRDVTIQWAFGVSAIGATLVYVLCRENFLPFYIMFVSYCWLTLIGLLTLCFFIDWKDTTFRTTILLPFAICTALSAILGLASWVSEMLFCTEIMSEDHQNQQFVVFGTALLPWFFNRGVHLLWHCSSALLAWLGIQTLVAAKGTLHGWGEAKLCWWGAPYVSFYKPKV
jgi:hypothetical protein